MASTVYRGKRKDTGVWIEGYLFCSNGEIYILSGMNFANPNMARVAADTVERYTGIYDKNGKEVCEGDIVRTEFGRLCVVKWHNTSSHCGWDLSYYESPGNHILPPPSPSRMFNSNYLEVIGNVHDGIPEFNIGTVYFDDGHTEDILRLYDRNDDIPKEVVTGLNSFMFTTVSGDYRFGYCLRAIGDGSSILYYKNPVFEKHMPGEDLWCSVKGIEKVELKTK